jgi:hypothetical protein
MGGGYFGELSFKKVEVLTSVKNVAEQVKEERPSLL